MSEHNWTPEEIARLYEAVKYFANDERWELAHGSALAWWALVVGRTRLDVCPFEAEREWKRFVEETLAAEKALQARQAVARGGKQ